VGSRAPTIVTTSTGEWTRERVEGAADERSQDLLCAMH